MSNLIYLKVLCFYLVLNFNWYLIYKREVLDIFFWYDLKNSRESNQMQLDAFVWKKI